MTAPNLGPCHCEVVYSDGRGGRAYVAHEHSDFAPYACADCGCEAHTAAAIPGAHSNADAQTTHGAGDRTPVTLPAELGFAQDRVTHTAEWLDTVTAGIRETHPTAADDPIAVCALADMLEQHGTAASIDPWDALALHIRRHTTTRGQLARGILRRATDNLRRPR